MIAKVRHTGRVCLWLGTFLIQPVSNPERPSNYPQINPNTQPHTLWACSRTFFLLVAGLAVVLARYRWVRCEGALGKPLKGFPTWRLVFSKTKIWTPCTWLLFIAPSLLNSIENPSKTLKLHVLVTCVCGLVIFPTYTLICCWAKAQFICVLPNLTFKSCPIKKSENHDCQNLGHLYPSSMTPLLRCPQIDLHFLIRVMVIFLDCSHRLL